MQLLISSLFTLFTLIHLIQTAPAPAPAPEIVPTDPSRFKFYPLPQPLSGPCDLCQGTDGALWGQDQFVNQLFRIDPKSGAIQTFTIPFTLPPVANASLPSVAGRTALACAIRPGADGNIYSAFGTRNQLVRINPKTKHIDVFTPDNPTQPAGNLQPFNDIWSSQTGIWYTQSTANLVSFFSFKSQRFTHYPVPTPNAGPVGMFVDSAGTPWTAELTANKIASLDPKSGVFTEYPVPLPALAGPAVIRAETQNRYIWFTALLGNSVGRFDKVTKKFTAVANPLPGGAPTEDTVDAKGDVWFSSLNQNVLSRIDAASVSSSSSSSGKVEQVVVPGTTVVAPTSVPLFVTIAVNYGPGNAIWFTNELGNRVGRYSLD